MRGTKTMSERPGHRGPGGGLRDEDEGPGKTQLIEALGDQGEDSCLVLRAMERHLRILN